MATQSELTDVRIFTNKAVFAERNVTDQTSLGTTEYRERLIAGLDTTFTHLLLLVFIELMQIYVELF